jgi:hypothetical protein
MSFSKKKLGRDISNSIKACACWGQRDVGPAGGGRCVVDDDGPGCVVCVRRLGNDVLLCTGLCCAADSEDMLPTSYPQDGDVADETAVPEVFWAGGRLSGFSSGRTARIVTGLAPDCPDPPRA